ncbi:flagellar hook-basal body protein [Legionella worsleiensis]|uniref:Flagellar basal body rod protein FlgF n=1 Tax=Legionella worsleiensis TaxID=45076 RepID=A0A0W1A5Z8_9GAMM|nr:flagellar hook-basal body protein [Legionella worsleiensis]KTD76767.1 flagellar basal body rod protein FlgF [Legionella worsleiensis]STY30585.1 flagellar basal-body rod protein FlgF [Legionella worsleiensis]
MLDAISATQFAMELDQLKLQSISQNIANMNTPGFKRQLAESTGFDEQLEPQIMHTMQQIHQTQIHTQGTLIQTHKTSDFALTGNSYFQVQGEQGIFYTRRGDFQINSHGELCTATGETLLGAGGTIKVDDNSFTVDAQGSLYIDHHKVDQLNVVQFDHPQSLEYAGNGLYQTNESPYPCDGSTRVLQGFIEQSNVKSIDEMMDMIKTSRHFEASQRIMRTADNLLSTAINQLGEGNV